MRETESRRSAEEDSALLALTFQSLELQQGEGRESWWPLSYVLEFTLLNDYILFLHTNCKGTMLVKQPKFRSLMGWGMCVWKWVLRLCDKG